MHPFVFHSHTQGKAQKHRVPLVCVFTWLLFFVIHCHTHTHTHSVCECSVPRTSTSCEWVFSRDESTGECVLGCQSVLSSLFVFFSPLFHLLTLLSCPFFTLHSPLFCMHTHQHLMPLLTHSVVSIDSPLHPMCVIHHHKHTHSHKAILESQWIDVCISQCALFAVCHPHCLILDRCVCVTVTRSLVNVFDTE